MDAEAYLATAALAREVIASPEVAAAWDRPSVLESYTVGGLAGHLARGMLSLEEYLGQMEAEPGAGDGAGVDTSIMVDAAGYFATALADHDPVASDLHATVRARSIAVAEGGADALAARTGDVLARLTDRLAAAAPSMPVVVLGGIVLTIADYVETRLVELVVHLDDLATSVGLDDLPSRVPTAAYLTVAGVLGRVAVHRAGALPTIRSLTRRERHPDAVRAF